MRNLPPLVLILAFSFAAHGARKVAKEEDLVLRPVVSPQGIQRIYENIEIAQTNIADTQANIQACEKNRAVVIAELQEIDKLEREQVGLIKGYEAYLQAARVEVDKNDEGLKELQKFEQENKSKLTANAGRSQLDLAAKLNTTRQEIGTRLKWKQDADAKVARVQKLMVGARENLRNIQERRSPLKAQLAGWVDRQAEFKKVLVQYTEKKAELERLAELKKKELPTEVTQ